MRKLNVDTDRLIELFCDINNLFINIRGNILSTEESKTKVIQARQSDIKSKIAVMINESYGLSNILGGEYHPFQLKPADVKKILEKL